MRGRILLAALIFIVPVAGTLPAAPTGGEYYLSDESGMAFRRVARLAAQGSPYYLQVSGVGTEREVRRLFHEGRETARWEYTLDAAGRLRSETVYRSGVIAERRSYGDFGIILRDERFLRGRLAEKTVNSYAGTVLLSASHEDGAGTPLFVDRFSYASAGTVREVERRYADGRVRISRFSERGGIPTEVWLGSGKDGSRATYGPDGSIALREDWSGGTLAGRERYTYADGTLVSSRSEDIGGKAATERTYDVDGHVILEVVTVDGKETSRTSCAYASGQLSAKVRRAPDPETGRVIREDWTYRYGSDGKLAGEDYSRDGQLVKSIVHTAGNEYHEDLYRAGVVFLRVFYRDSKKVREEFILNGSTRTRNFD